MKEEQGVLTAALLPDRLHEPWLTAFKRYHARITEARERLFLVEEAWNTFAPVLASRFDLGPSDEIDAEGRILRQPVGEEQE